jgi:hypothetical protein
MKKVNEDVATKQQNKAFCLFTVHTTLFWASVESIPTMHYYHSNTTSVLALIFVNEVHKGYRWEWVFPFAAHSRFPCLCVRACPAVSASHLLLLLTVSPHNSRIETRDLFKPHRFVDRLPGNRTYKSPSSRKSPRIDETESALNWHASFSAISASTSSPPPSLRELHVGLWLLDHSFDAWWYLTTKV